MIRISLILTLCLNSLVEIQAQGNLISNWSFEELKPNMFGDTFCPASGGQLACIKNWKSAWGSVDYFNACSNEEWPLYGVPSNYYGAQRPYEGLAYGALSTYAEAYTNSREFLRQQLAAPLKPNQAYRVSFWVSLCDSLEFASNGFGVLFTTDDTQLWQSSDFFNAQPQVEYTGPPVEDKISWTRIEGTFHALGGEIFITIGNFLTDTDPDFQAVRVADTPNQPDSWDGTGYYIDAISLFEDNSIGIAEQEAELLQLYPNPTTSEVALHYTTSHNGPLQWQVTDMAGRVVHVQSLQGPAGRATLGKTLPSGVYISTLRTNEAGLGSIKLVVL